MKWPPMSLLLLAWESEVFGIAHTLLSFFILQYFQAQALAIPECLTVHYLQVKPYGNAREQEGICVNNLCFRSNSLSNEKPRF